MDSNMKSVLRKYLNKCGEGRGLDKFLRRNSIGSDESSQSQPNCPITTKPRNKTKSLTGSLPDLHNEEHCCERENPPDQQQQEVNKSLEDLKPHMEQQSKVIVTQKTERIGKKKSFHCESVIEISLPPALTQPQPITEAPRDERLEEPIKPVICTQLKAKIPSQNINMSPPSAHESYVSNKQNPMEWDSFIPGYESTQQNNPMELGEKELNALKTYFKQMGLKLPNENLVVVIKNQTDPRAERDQQLSEIRKNKEKWQNIYEKYKEKYHLHSNIEFMSPDARSTPKLPDPISKMTEKSSQTSLVRNTVKSTQVGDSTLHKNSKEASLSSTPENVEYQNQSEVAESFEFIAGSKQQQQSEKETHASSSSGSSSGDTGRHSGENSKKDNEPSFKNEDITNFDDSLKVAIALLNSLLESRHMKPELKRNLAGKVIQKIVQIQTSRSIQTSTLGSSGIYPLSNSSRASSVVVKSAKEVPVKEPPSRESSKSSSKRSRESVMKDCLKPMTQSEVIYQHSLEEEPTKGSSGSKNIPKDQLMDYVKREKQSHLKWIEKEIDHLRNLRDLLKRNDTPISIGENCPIYENLSLLVKANSSKEDSEKVVEPEPDAPPVWNSHANLKKSSKHRSKLETPENLVQSNEESLASFIDSKNKKFIEKYEKNQKLYEDVNVYTQPFSGSKHANKFKHAIRKSKQTVTKDVQTSTSLASSSVFESSESISVPADTKTSSTLGTHKNKKISKSRFAGTQTTDSICRTRPVYEAKGASECFGTTSTTVTQRVTRIQNDKNQQTNPPSIKYTLTFDKKTKPSIRSYMSLPQKGNSEYTYVSKISKEIYNQISSATLDNRQSEDKENYDADSNDEYGELDLQSCLNKNRPDIFTRVEERKRCITELKKLRALRNEHRKKLLLLTSDKSLEGKLFNLPEMSLKANRMFSTKALKLQTQKTFKNLTEVRQKKKDENVKNWKRKTRIMTEIFNKNLQQNVLKGNLNLSNTVNLLSK